MDILITDFYWKLALFSLSSWPLCIPWLIYVPLWLIFFVAFEAVESSCAMPLLRQVTTGNDNSSDSSYSRRFSLAAGTTFIVECTIKNLTLCPSSKYLWVLKWPKFRGWQFIIHMSSSCFNFIQKIGQCERNKSPKYIIMILKKRLYIYSIWNFLTLFVDEMIKLMSYPSFSVAFSHGKTQICYSLSL